VPEHCGTATPLGVLDADPPRLVVPMRRLEEPSSKSSRPLTSLCRPRAPPDRFQADQQLPPRSRSTVYAVRFYPPDQDRPTVLPPRGELLSVRREWRNDPRRLPSCRFPASLWPIVVAVSATPTRHLAASDRIESLTRTFDGTERDSHTDSLERMLVHAPLRGLLPTGFPRERLTPPEAELLFRAHGPPCQR
jgi:hypothetical protein